MEFFEGFEEDGYTFFNDMPDIIEPEPILMKKTSSKFKTAAWKQAIKVAFAVM